MNIKEYLSGHSTAEIRTGQSGADVYEIDGRYVLKYAARQTLKKEQFTAYTREALFYRDRMVRQITYIPEVLKAEASENEIFILMKKYDCPKRSGINAELIQKIAKALAALHTDKPTPFMNRDKKKAEPIPSSSIGEYLGGWKSVLAEHKGAFDDSLLEKIAGKINELIIWHDSEEPVPVHGDFHWDNLLKDENGRILLCDWQGVHLGGASGDLSFFLSRLGGDGIRLDTAVFVDYYVNAVREISGKQIVRQDMIRHMNAANVITSFAFWHEYLHGSSEERVRDIYGRMAKDFNEL